MFEPAPLDDEDEAAELVPLAAAAEPEAMAPVALDIIEVMVLLPDIVMLMDADALDELPVGPAAAALDEPAVAAQPATVGRLVTPLVAQSWSANLMVAAGKIVSLRDEPGAQCASGIAGVR